MYLYRLTTPTHTFTLPIDTNECSVIQVIYKQGDNVLIKEYNRGVMSDGMELSGAKVIISLSQEDTQHMLYGVVDIQVRVLTTGGKAYASQHFSINVDRVNSEDILK